MQGCAAKERRERIFVSLKLEIMTHELPDYPGEMPPPPEKKPEALSKREVVALEILKISSREPWQMMYDRPDDLRQRVRDCFMIADVFLSESKK